jgi:hypothetical protein
MALPSPNRLRDCPFIQGSRTCMQVTPSSELFGVQLNVAGDGAGLKVSVVVGSVRLWNSLIRLVR